MRIHLLNCPFCGSEAKLLPPEDGDLAWPDFEVICMGQYCDARLTGNSEKDVADCWNRRA